MDADDRWSAAVAAMATTRDLFPLAFVRARRLVVAKMNDIAATACNGMVGVVLASSWFRPASVLSLWFSFR